MKKLSKSKGNIKSKIQPTRTQAKSKLSVEKRRTGIKDKVKKIRDLNEAEKIQLEKALKKIEAATIYDKGLNRLDGGFAKSTVGEYDADTIDVLLEYGSKEGKSGSEKITINRKTMEVMRDPKLKSEGPFYLKEAIIEWQEGKNDRVVENRSYDNWEDLETQVLYVYDETEGGYNKTKIKFVWDNGATKQLRIDVGPSDFNFSSGRLKDYFSANKGMNYGSTRKQEDVDAGLYKWEFSKEAKEKGMASGGYVKTDGKYQINVHGDKPDDYKIVCTLTRQGGKEIQVCYHERNDKTNKGVEVYSGKNYIVGSNNPSFSKRYDIDQVPVKYKPIVDELTKEHHKRWGGKESMAKGGVISKEQLDNLSNLLQGGKEEISEGKKIYESLNKPDKDKFIEYWIEISGNEGDRYGRKKALNDINYLLYEQEFSHGGSMATGGEVGGLESLKNKIQESFKESNKWHFLGDSINGSIIQLKFFVGQKEVDTQIFKIDGIDYSGHIPSSPKRNAYNAIIETLDKKFGSMASGGKVKELRFDKHADVWRYRGDKREKDFFKKGEGIFASLIKDEGDHYIAISSSDDELSFWVPKDAVTISDYKEGRTMASGGGVDKNIISKKTSVWVGRNGYDVDSDKDLWNLLVGKTQEQYYDIVEVNGSKKRLNTWIKLLADKHGFEYPYYQKYSSGGSMATGGKTKGIEEKAIEFYKANQDKEEEGFWSAFHDNFEDQKAFTIETGGNITVGIIPVDKKTIIGVGMDDIVKYTAKTNMDPSDIFYDDDAIENATVLHRGYKNGGRTESKKPTTISKLKKGDEFRKVLTYSDEKYLRTFPQHERGDARKDLTEKVYVADGKIRDLYHYRTKSKNPTSFLTSEDIEVIRLEDGGRMAYGGVIGDKRAQEIAKSIVAIGKKEGIDLPNLSNLAENGALPGNALEAYEEFKYWVNNGGNEKSFRFPYDDSVRFTDYIKSTLPNKLQRVMYKEYGDEAIRNAFPGYAQGGKMPDIPRLKKNATWEDVKTYLKWLHASPYQYHIDDEPRDVSNFTPEVAEILQHNSDIMWKFSDSPEGKNLWDAYYPLDEENMTSGGKVANKKVAKVMREFKHGKLRSGSGQKVTDRDQAIAIALSESGQSRNKDLGGKVDMNKLADEDIRSDYPVKHDPKRIWTIWSPKQRTHFLMDHFSSEDGPTTKGKTFDADAAVYFEYDDLPEVVKYELRNHISEGRYEAGGMSK